MTAEQIRNRERILTSILVLTIVAALIFNFIDRDSSFRTNVEGNIDKGGSGNYTADTIMGKDVSRGSVDANKANAANKKAKDILEFEAQFKEFQAQLKECVEECDLDKLFELSNNWTLDGAYSEGYGAGLYKLYMKVGPKTFISKLGKSNSSNTDEIIFLLVSEFPPKHMKSEANEFEKEFDRLKSDSSLSPKEIYIVYETLAKIKYFKCYT